MKRKGFTLIELLGVIVVLAVIAIITTPVILGVIEKSKKESYRNSIYGIIESANIYLANHLTSIGRTKEIAFTCNGINCSNEEGDLLDFKGTVPKSGTFYLNGTGEVTVESVYNGKYYANTVDDKVEITEEDTTLSRAELTNMVKDLQQEVKQLKTQVQQSNQNTSNIAALQTKHESDVTSIWNKVGTEDLSSISKGSISKILIDQNKVINNLTNVKTKGWTNTNSNINIISWSIHKSGNKIQLFVPFKVNNAISAGSSLFALDSDCAPSTSYFFGIIRTDASGSRMGNVNQNESVVRTVDILNAGYYMIDTVIYQ